MPSIGDADAEISALEGEVRYRLVRHRSRERTLRNAKIQSALNAGQLKCEVPRCGFVFEERYGPLGAGYAQVHHLQPLAATDAVVETKLEDLAIVCANCHVMIHLGGECRSLDSLIPE
jgi:predicted HNH restriction endonuclease